MTAEHNLAQETLRHRLDELPEKISAHVRMGFHLLSRLDNNQRDEFTRYIIEITEKGENLDRDKAVSVSGLDVHTVADALSALATAIGATVDIEVGVDDFVKFGSGKIFADEDSGTVRAIIGIIVSSRQRLKAGMRDSALANSVLPSLQGLFVEVDYRVRFDGQSDKAVGGVAVAVCNLKTDVSDDTWFQASVSDLEGIVERLQGVVARMRSVEQSVRLDVAL